MNRKKIEFLKNFFLVANRAAICPHQCTLGVNRRKQATDRPSCSLTYCFCESIKLLAQSLFYPLTKCWKMKTTEIDNSLYISAATMFGVLCWAMMTYMCLYYGVGKYFSYWSRAVTWVLIIFV